jgi:hypothetical protein
MVETHESVWVVGQEMLVSKPWSADMKRWLCAIGLTLSLGCASAVVRPYVGDQQAWPIASGGIVNTKYGLPVFTSLPPVPYDVLAEMRISSPFYAQPEEGHLPVLVNGAKKIGGDALLFVQGKIFFSTNYGQRNGAGQEAAGQSAPSLTTVNTFNPESFAPEVTILAIRWVGDAPPGLPVHKKAGATKPPQLTPAPAPVAVAPAATPPAVADKPDEQKPGETPPAEQPKAETAPATSPTNTPPASPSGQ